MAGNQDNHMPELLQPIIGCYMLAMVVQICGCNNLKNDDCFNHWQPLCYCHYANSKVDQGGLFIMASATHYAMQFTVNAIAKGN